MLGLTLNAVDFSGMEQAENFEYIRHHYTTISILHNLYPFMNS